VPSLPESPRLRRILLAYTVNQLGTWLAYVALLLSTYDHTHSALAVAGLLLAGRLLPALLTPTLVAIVEVSRRRRSLSALYLVEAVTAVALAALLWHFWLPGVVVLVAIDGMAALTAGALLRATAARVAVEEIALSDSSSSEDAAPSRTQVSIGRGGGVAQLASIEGAEETAQRRANASLNMAFTVAVTLGPAVSGVIVAAAGSPTALLIDAVSFMICGALLMNVQVQASQDRTMWQDKAVTQSSTAPQDGAVPQDRTAPQDGATRAGSVRARLGGAWRHLQDVPRLRGLLLVEALAIVCFASVEPVEVLYAKATLHAGDRGFGFLTAAWGVGMVLGGVVFARSVERPLRPMLTWGTLAVGMAYIGFAISPTLAVACGAAVIGGLGNGVQWAALISAVQRLTPRELLGGLMSTVEAIGALCPAVGFVIGGVVAELSSPRTAMLSAGVAATLTTGLFVRVTRGEMSKRASASQAAEPPRGASTSRPSELSAEAAPEHR
jgi:predicted MFS family arabinose efflux permease